ncbi:MAG: dihydrodipicolinate synthase family protein [Acidobacteria bacterium]|nr:dihydrodipicolinate synthase family protein [Acidobacteriota bacterium]
MASILFPTTSLSRRGFLAGTVAATVVALQGRSRAAAAPVLPEPESETAAERIYRRLRGPVVPINIPLAKDFSVDYGNLRAYVDFLCENQAPVIFFTHGSSEFKSMSEGEIEKLCRTAAEQARGRALVIGGTGKWWTGKSTDFIRRLEDSGVDGINLHLFTTKPEEVYAAFAEVAGQTRLPLLGYDENYPADLVARLSTIPGVCGLKSHDALYRYHDFIRAVEGKKFVIVGGGQMRNFLYGYLIGSQGYLCAYAPFAPAIAFRFYGALERNDLDEARRVMFEYEDPLMKVAGGLGWGQSIKSILQIKGLFQTNLWRPPVPSHGPEPKKQLRQFLADKGLL